ncbi:trimethyllysine dioxygenase, mitochondrial-like [Hyposmocoma kahamanoa]|uniref:trimethyllysine dioxygenase, mitochondrial-like n=1 Tax=Hyposmocoma kahamanoa TaxID=1477025 RepID=UPI000E6D9F21|nr:trimethyllysine dioxygenase, mitochondrial-like [Hyposmocoma kahamanoa]
MIVIQNVPYRLTYDCSLQVLHCFEHVNGIGGVTILADGFYGATRLKEEHFEDFQLLTTLDVDAEYLEDGHHHRYAAPIITIDKRTEDIVQIRFNVYDRSAMPLANSEECRAYYRSLRNLARYYEDTNNQWQFKLRPGTVLVIDNFRVLHGRTSFSGSRTLGGSYVTRSDWLDRARTLKLIK